jgi:hypothetical protein
MEPETAKLPENLVRGPDPLLKDIEVGETVFVDVNMLVVDPKRNCWLLPDARFKREKGIIHCLRVTRSANKFHVAILMRWRWMPEQVNRADLIPVASLVEEYDPDFELPQPAKRK